MRKKVFGRKLNRNRKSRTALFRSLMKAMVVNGSIKTTRAKGLAVQKDLEKLVKYVKDDSLLAKRKALADLANDKSVTNMLFEKYKLLANSRASGFTKIALATNRKGDNAEMVQISWVEVEEKKK